MRFLINFCYFLSFLYKNFKKNDLKSSIFRSSSKQYMITKVELGSVENKNITPQSKSVKGSNVGHPNFTGLGDLALKGIQLCEQYPMVNVSVLDCSTAIFPRTFFETFIGSKKKDENGNHHRKLNIAAGFEAFRREASGLIINCLIPSFLVIAAAKVLNRPIMGDYKKSNLTKSWANSESIDSISKYYTSAQGQNTEGRIYNALKNMTHDIVGVDGAKEVVFKDVLQNDAEFEKLLKSTAKNIASGHREEVVSNSVVARGLKKLFGIKSYKNYTDDLY